MRRLRMLVPLALAALLAVARPVPSHGQEIAVPPPTVERFDRFIARAAPICRSSPSTACVDEAWAYGDADGDGRLVPGEATALRDALTGWAEWPGNSAGDDERALIFLGLSMMEATGLDRLITSLDGDRDGAVSRSELLADVRLDDRPLGEVLMDPKSVDRRSLGRRLGALAPMLGVFFQQAAR